MIETGAHRILLWGASSKARILAAMVEELGAGEITAIYDPTREVSGFDSPAVFTNDPAMLDTLMPTLTAAVIAIGAAHGAARFATARSLEGAGLSGLSLCHPRAWCDPTAKVGAGLQLMPGAIIHKFCELGEQVIVNTNATIDHECQIGHGCHIMGSAAIAGRVRIGDHATIGTNATILPDLHIGAGAYIGAGAVVTRDVPPGAVMVGVPARHVRDLPPIAKAIGLYDAAQPSSKYRPGEG